MMVKKKIKKSTLSKDSAKKSKEEESSTPKKKHILLRINDAVYKTYPTKKYLSRKKYKPLDPKKLTSFIPGTIKKIYVKEGDEVLKKDKLFVLEAMKMNNVILSPMDGKIKKIKIKVKDVVAKNQVLIEFE